MPFRSGAAGLVTVTFAIAFLAEAVERTDHPLFLRGAAPSASPPPSPSTSLGQASLAVKHGYPFYHSSAELRTEVQRLARVGGCPGANLTVRTVTDSGTEIEMINVRSSTKATPTNRVFLVSGEHARELIGPESVLYFLRALCGDGDAKFGAGTVATSFLEGASVSTDRIDVLQKSEFGVVINANPRSRLNVEKGDYCLRANPDSVDLNRNWDEHWVSNEDERVLDDIGGSGSKPFSEPETRIVKNLLSEFKPTTFLSIHSGTLGMYMPWAYSTNSLATSNQASMLKVLEELDQNHCQCPYGAAGKEVGYPCAGTSVDYAYDALKAPYSFAFEIFGGDAEDLKERWQNKQRARGQMLLQGDVALATDLAAPFFHDLFAEHPSEFVGASRSSLLQTGSETADADWCMTQFNPKDQVSYDRTVQNWASAYADMSLHIALQNKRTTGNATRTSKLRVSKHAGI